jgi:hypothetical protein
MQEQKQILFEDDKARKARAKAVALALHQPNISPTMKR